MDKCLRASEREVAKNILITTWGTLAEPFGAPGREQREWSRRSSPRHKCRQSSVTAEQAARAEVSRVVPQRVDAGNASGLRPLPLRLPSPSLPHPLLSVSWPSALSRSAAAASTGHQHRHPPSHLWLALTFRDGAFSKRVYIPFRATPSVKPEAVVRPWGNPETIDRAFIFVVSDLISELLQSVVPILLAPCQTSRQLALRTHYPKCAKSKIILAYTLVVALRKSQNLGTKTTPHSILIPFPVSSFPRSLPKYMRPACELVVLLL